MKPIWMIKSKYVSFSGIARCRYTYYIYRIFGKPYYFGGKFPYVRSFKQHLKELGR